MRTISGWQDLLVYGIDALTGEACGLSYRILCDVTARGKRIVEKCLDCTLQLAENWNGGSKDDPHVGSIMLAPELLIPIGVFALLESGCIVVWLGKNGNLVGIEPSDPPEDVER